MCACNDREDDQRAAFLGSMTDLLKKYSRAAGERSQWKNVEAIGRGRGRKGFRMRGKCDKGLQVLLPPSKLSGV